jgi:hypothetical protein
MIYRYFCNINSNFEGAVGRSCATKLTVIDIIITHTVIIILLLDPTSSLFLVSMQHHQRSISYAAALKTVSAWVLALLKCWMNLIDEPLNVRV